MFGSDQRKIAAVGSQDLLDVEPFGFCHNGGVNEAQISVSVGIQDLDASGEVRNQERLDGQLSASRSGYESPLHLLAQICVDKVADLGEDGYGNDQ